MGWLWMGTRAVMVALAGAVVAVVGFVGSSGAVSGAASARVPRRNQVFVVGANGQDLRQLTSGHLPHSVLGWMPGGASVADVVSTGRSQEAWIESQRTSGSGHRRLSAIVSTPYAPSLVFSPASGLTVFESFGESGIVLKTVGLPGSRPRVLDSWSNLGNAGSLTGAWSPNGGLIAYAPLSAPPSGPYPGAWDITVTAPNGQGRRVLTSGLVDNNLTPLFSPDGQSILFCVEAPGAGLFTVPTQGGPVHRITNGQCPDVMAWSPNGKEIAYILTPFGSVHAYLYVVDVRTGRVIRLAGPVQDNGALAWSPDGKKIAFGGTGPASLQRAVETINANGTGLRDLVQIRGYSGTYGLAWSRNGKQIALTAGPSSRCSCY